MTQKLINAGLALGLIAVCAVAFFVGGGPRLAGGAYEALPKWFGNGFTAGLTQQLSVDTSGNISTTGTYAVNGATTTTSRIVPTTATTTVCAIQSPAATTTLDRFIASFTTSSTTASTVTIAKAATQYATTTVLATSTIAANAPATISGLASTTPGDLGKQAAIDRIFGPSQWVVVGMTGGVGTFSPVGACIAEFKSTI